MEVEAEGVRGVGGVAFGGGAGSGVGGGVIRSANVFQSFGRPTVTRIKKKK